MKSNNLQNSLDNGHYKKVFLNQAPSFVYVDGADLDPEAVTEGNIVILTDD